MNALLLSQLLGNVLQQAVQYQQIQAQMHAEGRTDLTEAEVAIVSAGAHAAIANLHAAVAAGDAGTPATSG